MRRTKTQIDNAMENYPSTPIPMDALNKFSCYTLCDLWVHFLTASKNLTGRTSSIKKE